MFYICMYDALSIFIVHICVYKYIYINLYLCPAQARMLSPLLLLLLLNLGASRPCVFALLLLLNLGASRPCDFAMPPVKAEPSTEKAENRPIKVCDKKVDVEHLNLSRSWRCHDLGRVAALKVVYGIKHEFGVTLLASIKVLEATDTAGCHYVDDGASTVWALVDLKADWEQNKTEMLNGDAWDPVLVDVFIDGLQVTVHKYEDDSPAARALHLSQVHCVESNSFRATTPTTILDVGAHALACSSAKRDEAIKYIMKFQGKGSKWRAASWVDFANALRDTKYKEVKDKLKSMPGLPSSYVIGNSSFCSSGAKASQDSHVQILVYCDLLMLQYCPVTFFYCFNIVMF
jgi:hypothetical protein